MDLITSRRPVHAQNLRYNSVYNSLCLKIDLNEYFSDSYSHDPPPATKKVTITQLPAHCYLNEEQVLGLCCYSSLN